MSTVETLIDEGIKRSGLKVEEVADRAGVSVPTLHRHRKGKSPNGYTTENCMVSLVEEGIVEPEVLPAYCSERCLIGQARLKSNLKAHRKKKSRTAIREKLRNLYTTILTYINPVINVSRQRHL